VDVIREYASGYGERVRWVSEPDTGIYNAMNKGVHMARGTYITVIGAGDWMENDALEAVFDRIDTDPKSDAIYGVTRIWESDLQTSRIVQTLPDALLEHPMQHPALYYKKSLHDDFGLYDERYMIAADYLFCLKAFYHGKGSLSPIDRTVVNFIKDGRSSKHKYRSLWENYRAKRDAGLRVNIYGEFFPQIKNKVLRLCQK
jgi:glycosyltransferase involved in cell wall biosynthesis